MDALKKTAKPYLFLFGIALIIALLARIGLAFMGSTGLLAFDYISASGVAILDLICSILTGSAFVAFLFAAALVLCLSTAGCVLYGILYAKGNSGAGKMSTAFVWGWATALVAIVCLVIVASGILSSVQVGSMSSKLPGVGVLVLGMIAFAAFLGTLLGAASLVVCACIARAKSDQKSLGASLLVATAVCGLVVMILTVGTFGAINQVSINTSVLLGWLVCDIVVNVGIMLVSRSMLLRRAEGKVPASRMASSHS